MAYVTTKRNLKGRLGDYCNIDPVTGGRVCLPGTAPAPAAVATPAAASCPPCNCPAPKIPNPIPAPVSGGVGIKPSPLVKPPVIPARVPSAAPRVSTFVPTTAQLANPKQYFGAGTWSTGGKIYGTPGTTPGLPANPNKAQVYGKWRFNPATHAWMLSGLRGLGNYVMRSHRLRGLGDQCVIDATGARICQPSATTAAAPAPVAVATPVPQPAAPPPPVIISSPNFSAAQINNPVASFGPGTWSYAGKIFGTPGVSPGLPANPNKAQSYGNWVFNQALHSWQYGSAQAAVGVPLPSVTPPPTTTPVPTIAVSSTGQPLQVGQCQAGSNPGAACLSNQDCFGGGICNTGVISSGVYSYPGSGAFPSYPSSIPGSVDYGATPAPASGLPTWAWIAIAAGAALVLPKIL